MILWELGDDFDGAHPVGGERLLEGDVDELKLYFFLLFFDFGRV